MNTDLITATVAYARMHPEQHSQISYACGTTACLAGHAMLLSGYTLRRDHFIRPDGVMVDFEFEEAQLLMGISHDQATAVFHCYDKETAIERLEAIAKGEGADDGH